MSKDPFAPEYQSSTGLPIAIILAAALAITSYLVIGGSLANKDVGGTKVYPPESASINGNR